MFGWTLVIPKDIAIQYVNTYGNSPNTGFLKNMGNVTFSHGAGMLTLSEEEEAQQTVSFIKSAYPSSF